MSVRRIIEAFESWRGRQAPLVLATVCETLGSTYSKAGHRILIAANGDYRGLVSGGCLEGDLASRAARALAEDAPAIVTYDMRDEADELWGLGVGCNGLIRVLLEPMSAGGGYEPYASIAAAHLERGGALATVLGGGDDGLSVGAAVILTEKGAHALGRSPLPAAWRQRLAAGCEASLEAGRPAVVEEPGGVRVLYAPIPSIPRVLVLGGGPDAVPVTAMLAEVGWRVTVADHRPAYLERGGFERADAVLAVRPQTAAEALDFAGFDGVLVMSHHLDSDRAYLEQIAVSGARPAYLGVLGPPARRAKLLTALGERGEALRPILRGPVGLRIGADSPEAIALSIAAEMQSVFAEAAVSLRPARACLRPA